MVQGELDSKLITSRQTLVGEPIFLFTLETPAHGKAQEKG
jgi:hypothetical protein